jgi:hypothetical protein
MFKKIIKKLKLDYCKTKIIAAANAKPKHERTNQLK